MNQVSSGGNASENTPLLIRLTQSCSNLVFKAYLCESDQSERQTNRRIDIVTYINRINPLRDGLRENTISLT